MRAGADAILADLAARMVARRLYKTIEIGDDPAVADALVPALEAAARALLGERAPYYWAIDRAERLGYDARPGEEIFVVGHPRRGTLDLGSLLGNAGLPIGRQTFTLRIVCAPELAETFAPIAAAARAG